MTQTGSGTSKSDEPDASFEQLPIASLQGQHRQILRHAIANVLSSEVAKITYGQIIDGLPLSDVALDSYGDIACPGHPLLDEHLELSPEVLDKARQLYAIFDPDVLEVDSRVSNCIDNL